MKTKELFLRTHRVAWIAFPVCVILYLLCSLLFGEVPVFLVYLLFASLALLVMVVIACVAMNVSRKLRDKRGLELLRRFGISAVVCFVILVLLDYTTGSIAWAKDGGGALICGLLSLYARP